MPQNGSALNLEQVRRRKGISLESIADKTKISSRFLRAIESEEFDKLPGGIFNTNYIRQYAAAIDVPGERILNLYQAKVVAQSPEEDITSAPRRGWSLKSLLRMPSPVRF
jgi:cytoskeleton protein RodZ